MGGVGGLGERLEAAVDPAAVVGEVGRDGGREDGPAADAPAAEFAGELLAAYRGEDGLLGLKDLVRFGDWLNGLGLDDDAAGYRAAMALTLAEMAESYRD